MKPDLRYTYMFSYTEMSCSMIETVSNWLNKGSAFNPFHLTKETCPASQKLCPVEYRTVYNVKEPTKPDFSLSGLFLSFHILKN
jgi:hypothetical protein